MKNLFASAATAAVLACAGPESAQAASIYFLPATSTAQLSAGMASFDLMMDFAVSEATLGGSVDIDLNGPISLLDGLTSFRPSAFFLAVADPAFSGFGTLRADKDFEIHFGNFNGLSGTNVLGTFTVKLDAIGIGTLNLAANSFFGPFFTVAGAPQIVSMTGATITVVPEPASAWLMALGAGLIGLSRYPRRTAARSPL
jgi:PEP-CTERM motif